MSQFKIIATTDIHGAIMAHSYHNNAETPYSLSRIKTAIDSLKDENTILVDNGDVLQGTPLTSYDNNQPNSSVMAKAFNHLNYDYFNLGNHDFNYGPKVLERYLSQQKATGICCNILLNEEPIGNPIIHTFENGLTLGIIGVVTDYLPNWEKPENLESITILPVYETVKTELENIRDSVDFTCIVYHGGFEKDLTTGEPTEALTSENVGYELTTLEGLDILITGHQHRSLNQVVNKTLCLQCANNGSEFMMVEYKDNKLSGHLIKSADFDIDKDFESLFEEEEKQTQTWLDQVIGQGPDMHIPNVFEAQKNKSLFTTFINKVAIETMEADMAFCCLFPTSPGIKSEITMRDLVASYPFPNTFVLVEIDKDTLKEYLEKCANYFIVDENNELQINPSYLYPKLSMYDYDMGDGLSYTIDASKPMGERVTITELPDKDTFNLVVNNYRASGGGSFFMIRDCKKIKEDPREVIDIVYDYIKEHSPIEITNPNNVKVTK